MKSILDRSFQYTPAAQTDLRLTFWRIKEAREAGAKEYDSWTFDRQPENVSALKKKAAR